MRGRKRDMTGVKIERLTFIREAGRYISPTSGEGKIQWYVRCDCGVDKVVVLTHVLHGPFRVKSCGCFGNEQRGLSAIARCTKHGEARRGKLTREYNAYKGMKERCSNPGHKAWKNYGGRGVAICERWALSFENFLSDMGRCPPKLTLDRKNNDGNYEPDNCRWATAREQRMNQRPRTYRTGRG